MGERGSHRFSRFGRTHNTRPGGGEPRPDAMSFRDLAQKNGVDGGGGGTAGAGGQQEEGGSTITSNGFGPSPFPKVDEVAR